MVASNVANFEVSSSLGCTLANSTVAELDEIGSAVITERIKRDSRADELRELHRVKDRIGLVQDPVETRCGHLRAGLGIVNLTVTEPGVVPPAPVKQLVSLDADGA